MTWSPTSSARLRKQVSLVPVTERKRPSGPSGTTLCWRDTLDADGVRLEGERPHSGSTCRPRSRASPADPAAPWDGSSRYVTSSRVAHRRSGSPSKSVSVVPTSEKSRHGITKIIRSSSAGRYTARSVMRGSRQWIPFVVRITRGRSVGDPGHLAKPVDPRARAVDHDPSADRSTRCPVRRSRTRTPSMPSSPRTNSSTSQ